MHMMKRAFPCSPSRHLRVALGFFMIAAALHCAAPRNSSEKKSSQKEKNAVTYEQAVKLLRSPETWCEGADALAKIGDRAALIPLLEAYWSLDELPPRDCLKQAMESLDPRSEATRLVASSSPDERHNGVVLMSMFPAEEHVALLAHVLEQESDPALRAQAANALLVQKPNAAWKASVIKMLDSDQLALREIAVIALRRQWGDPILTALKKRLASETDARMRRKLEEAIRIHEEHATRQRP